jgi:hypothetical protein
MKTKIKELWIEALRSGKYQQGEGLLKTQDGKYCCLGVLCDIYAKTQKKKGFQKGKFQYYFQDKGNAALLPENVMKWSGIDSKFGNYKNNNLTTDNDNGKSFVQIAKIIEENF